MTSKSKQPQVESNAEQWMKEHSLQDIEDLIEEFSTKGENVTELSRVVHELEELVDEEHEWERQNPEKVRAETQ